MGYVTVRLSDLEDKYRLFYKNNYEDRTKLENWSKIADLVSNDCIILNESIKLGKTKTKNINYLDQFEVSNARDEFSKEQVSYLSGEAVTIYFLNMEIPKIGTEAAKQKTRTIIQEIYEKVKNGTYTMKQAGDAIAAMTDLGEIDSAYKSNAYYKFEHKTPTSPLFLDDEISEKVRQLDIGELSEILTGKEGQDKHEIYYMFVKLTDKNTTLFDSLDDLINQRKNKGMFITLK